MIGHARAYMAEGWPVFPVHGAEATGDAMKEPATKNGFYDASTEDRLAAIWWERHPTRGVALATGGPGGVWVLDLDGPEGIESWAKLLDAHGPIMPTVESETGNGRHLFFRMPTDRDVRNSAGKVAPKIDVRGTGGYVVLPPSPHPSGNRYRWANGRAPEQVPVVAAPAWLLDLVAPVGENGKRYPRAEPLADKIPSGQRNATLASLAGSMRRRGASRDSIAAALHAENASRCVPPMPHDEVERIADSIARYEPGPLGSLPHNDTAQAVDGTDPGLPTPDSFFFRTDMGNARRLVCWYGGVLRHYPGEDTWYAWDGRRWKADDVATVEHYAKETARRMITEANAIEDPDKRESALKWAVQTQGNARLAAMQRVARSEPEIVVRREDFDADPLLLNALNGTLSLGSSIEVKPHDPGDLITKLAQVEYVPGALAPRWEAFLAEVIPDPEVRAYVQRLIGYSLLGEIREHVLILMYGIGANGKSVFLDVLLSILGEFGAVAEPGLLLQHRHEQHPTGMADLQGRRFVATVEPDPGKALAESVVKMLTGGDRVKARKMRQDFYEFAPSWTIWMSANHLPRVRGTDDGIWRRIKLVPFTVTIPPARQDPNLKAKILEEAPGVLNWCLEGVRQYFAHGLTEPDAVVEATQQYRAESNPLGLFLEECTREGSNYSVDTSRLWEAWRAWCDENGHKAGTTTSFGRRMTDAGYERGRTGAGRFYVGLRLDDRAGLGVK